MEKGQREDLRNELIKFIKIKFSSRRDITCYAEDIVNDAFINLIQSKNYTSDKENFGYLSVTALRIAFSYFKKVNSSIKQLTPLNRCLNFISEDDFVKEIIKEEETKEILESLEILKKIERIIITQRYFGDLKFNEIAKRNNINLNTVKSHHRRALEKLRDKMIKNSCFTENETHISDVNELYDENHIIRGGNYVK